MDSHDLRAALAGLAILLVPFLFSLIVVVVIFFCALSERDIPEEPQTVPYKFTFLKSTIPFLFHGPSFFLYAS